MKKLLLASLMAALIISCKKEDPAPPTAPITPAGPTNYIILNGDGYNNDTVIADTVWCNYYPSASATNFYSGNSTTAIQLWPFASSTGTYSITQPTPTPANSLYVAGVWYRKANITAHITQYGAVGSIINCNYSGTFKKQADTTVVISVSGNFNVVRGNDM